MSRDPVHKLVLDECLSEETHTRNTRCAYGKVTFLTAKESLFEAAYVGKSNTTACLPLWYYASKTIYGYGPWIAFLGSCSKLSICG